MLEHLVGDRLAHAADIAGLHHAAELGRHAVEAEVVELERVVRRRAVERNLRARDRGHARAILGRVARDREHGNDQVHVVDAAAGTGCTLGNGRSQTRLEIVHRVHRMDMHAVTQLARDPAHVRTDGRDVDLDVLEVVARRRPLPGQEAQVVVRAFVLELLLATERANARLECADVVTHLRRGLVPLGRITSDDVTAHLAPEAEAEASARVLGHLPRDLGRDHRAARERDRDAGRERQLRGRFGRGRDHHPRDGAGFREEHAREARAFELVRERRAPLPRQAAGHQVEVHASLLPGRLRSLPPRAGDA